jgi:hypothetical protein
MTRDPKLTHLDGISRPNRPILEGVENRGGINTNPTTSLSRPPPPQPYKPATSASNKKEK